MGRRTPPDKFYKNGFLVLCSVWYPVLSLWIIAVINFVISGWNSYSSGRLWEMSDDALGKFIAGAVLVQGFVGMAYAFVLVAIGLGYLNPEYLLPTNVILGVPLLASGAVILVQSWVALIKNRSIGNFLVTLWNTVAFAWNVKVWLDALDATGGMVPAAGDLLDDDDAFVVLLVAVVLGAFLSLGLFQVGRESV